MLSQLRHQIQRSVSWRFYVGSLPWIIKMLTLEHLCCVIRKPSMSIHFPAKLGFKESSVRFATDRICIPKIGSSDSLSLSMPFHKDTAGVPVVETAKRGNGGLNHHAGKVASSSLYSVAQSLLCHRQLSRAAVLIVDHIASVGVAIISIGAMAIPKTLYMKTTFFCSILDSLFTHSIQNAPI